MGHPFYHSLRCAVAIVFLLGSMKVQVQANETVVNPEKSETPKTADFQEATLKEIQAVLKKWISMLKDEKISSQDLVLTFAHPEELKALKEEDLELYEQVLTTFKEKKGKELLQILEGLKLEDAKLENDLVEFTKDLPRTLRLSKFENQWYLMN